MLFFGVVGYLMKKFNYEAAPLVLALVLGPMMENALRQSLIMSNGSAGYFSYPADFPGHHAGGPGSFDPCPCFPG